MSNRDAYRDREPARTDNSVWEIGLSFLTFFKYLQDNRVIFLTFFKYLQGNRVNFPDICLNTYKATELSFLTFFKYLQGNRVIFSDNYKWELLCRFTQINFIQWIICSLGYYWCGDGNFISGRLGVIYLVKDWGRFKMYLLNFVNVFIYILFLHTKINCTVIQSIQVTFLLQPQASILNFLVFWSALNSKLVQNHLMNISTISESYICPVISKKIFEISANQNILLANGSHFELSMCNKNSNFVKY